MPVATITSKGQVTIPKKVRDSLGLRTGDKIEFVIGQQGELAVWPVTRRVDDVFGILHHPQRDSVSVEEMDHAIRDRVRSHHK